MSAELGAFVEGESQGDNPNPAYQSWHAKLLVACTKATGEGNVRVAIVQKC